jgi:hypothetical protein
MATGQEKSNRWLTSFFKALPDIILKITPAIATLVGGYLAVDFQSKSAGTNLLNQREQAETQLRASMFANLITPLVGADGDGDLDAEDERLLVEMLTLNFHEHVEFKPLLLHEDQKLLDKKLAASSEEDKERLEAMRSSLKSIVKRVLARQLSVLNKECANIDHPICAGDPNLSKSSCATLKENGDSEILLRNPQCIEFGQTAIAQGNAYQRVYSPDKGYLLEIYVETADWTEGIFELNIMIDALVPSEGKITEVPIDSLKFSITPYDLPFTDNTIVDDEHRFSVFVKAVSISDNEQDNLVDVSVVWFPPGYILSHERPFNYQEIRKVLKLDSNQ